MQLVEAQERLTPSTGLGSLISSASSAWLSDWAVGDRKYWSLTRYVGLSLVFQSLGPCTCIHQQQFIILHSFYRISCFMTFCLICHLALTEFLMLLCCFRWCLLHLCDQRKEQEQGPHGPRDQGAGGAGELLISGAKEVGPRDRGRQEEQEVGEAAMARTVPFLPTHPLPPSPGCTCHTHPSNCRR